MTTITPMDVTLATGERVRACCGPAVTAMVGVVAYRPVYAEARPGVCCHTGAVRRTGLMELYDTAVVHEALRGMLGR